MTHRVHTILSILAEDHAPAALRPSILLAVDWPTVAAEAPATGDDATAATLAALRIRGAITSDHQALAALAARLATVSASLTTTGDKAHALHATALWGAAATLVGLADNAPRRAAHDKALADIHALRDILKVPADGNIVDHASAFAERHVRRVDEATAEAHRVNEDNSRLRAQVDRMIAAMREDAPAPAKAIPQPGDVVPWAEVEDGALYYRKGYPCPFCMVVDRHLMVIYDAYDGDIVHLLANPSDFAAVGEPPAGPHEVKGVFVARDLGSDPEAWRRAMREWTANGNKCQHRQDGDASACDHCCMFG